MPNAITTDSTSTEVIQNEGIDLGNLPQQVDSSLSTLLTNVFGQDPGPLTHSILLFLIASITFWVVFKITKSVIINAVHNYAEKTKAVWDDYLLANKFFKTIANIVPLILLDFMSEIVFYKHQNINLFVQKSNNIIIVAVTMIALGKAITALGQYLMTKEQLKDKPINSYLQLVKIIVYIVFAIIIVSMISGTEPGYILTSLGAVSAVVILVFKDSILGFVGSIQIAANDLVRIGDWITISKFGADGTVIEISLTSVVIQNFDNTLTSVPTYSFVSDSFTNWRGMLDSGGRRIKRSINVQSSSVKFLKPEDLIKYNHIDALNNYLEKKSSDIAEFNQQLGDVNLEFNGRNQTNLGVFRAYLTSMLRELPDLNQEMTLMVRQLQPSNKGIPVEIYCFTKTKDWIQYEGVMADIFDHVFACMHWFDLEMNESPSGSDVREIAGKKTTSL